MINIVGANGSSTTKSDLLANNRYRAFRQVVRHQYIDIIAEFTAARMFKVVSANNNAPLKNQILWQTNVIVAAIKWKWLVDNNPIGNLESTFRPNSPVKCNQFNGRNIWTKRMHKNLSLLRSNADKRLGGLVYSDI